MNIFEKIMLYRHALNKIVDQLQPTVVKKKNAINYWQSKIYS